MNKNKLLVAFIILFALCLTSFLGFKVSASTIQTLWMNVPFKIEINQGETKEFDIYIPDSNYYYVRIDSYNTYEIDVETKNYYASTTGHNIFYEFKDVSGMVKMSVKCINKISSFAPEIVVRPMHASLIGIDYGSINTLPDLKVPYQRLSKFMSVKKYENTKDVIYALSHVDFRNMYMLNSPVFFYSGHGYNNGSGMALENNEAIYVGDIPKIRDNKISILSCCCGAYEGDNDYSIARKMVINGAMASLGWPCEIGPLVARAFTNKLFNYLCDGYTLSESAARAKASAVGKNIKKYVIFGNENIKIIDSSFIVNKTTSISEYKMNKDDDEELIEAINGNGIRVFKTINGVKTNVYFDCVYDNGDYAVSYKTENTLDNKKLLETKYSYKDSYKYNYVCNHFLITNVETELYYYIEKDTIIPIQYVQVSYKKENISMCLDFLVNLNTGREMDYEKYGVI